MVEFGGMEWMNELMKGFGSGIDFNDIVKQTQPVFPEYPVKVNDSWVSTTELKIPQLSGKTANMVMRSTLQGFETIDQSRCAVIQVSGNFDLSNMKFNLPGEKENKGTMPEINFKKLHQVIKGKIYHALVEGQMVKAEYDQNLGMEMAMTMSMPTTKTKSEITTSMDLVMHLTMELED
jgi:hypothetical protein